MDMLENNFDNFSYHIVGEYVRSYVPYIPQRSNKSFYVQEEDISGNSVMVLDKMKQAKAWLNEIPDKKLIKFLGLVELTRKRWTVKNGYGPRVKTATVEKVVSLYRTKKYDGGLAALKKPAKQKLKKQF